jgi:NADH-quinone oxidoreductase subunit M
VGVLTALILIPLVGAVLCVLVGRASERAPRWIALLTALVELGVAVLASDRALDAEPALAEVWDLAGEGGSWLWTWQLSLDGLSVPLVVLTAFLAVVAVLASWKVTKSPGAHHALLLALVAATMGVFLAATLVLFYAFWEAVLIPMFFLIGIWGHERRRHAAIKFFLYTFLGSVLMLVGLIIIIVTTGQASFEGLALVQVPVELQTVVFWLLAAGFLVKIPAWPLHTWLPDAHVEAPTAGSILLAGVLLKMGGYGLFRLAIPVAPEAFDGAAPVLAALGIVGIVYGAFMALAQTDLKRLIAYSSVAHMGFVLLAAGVASAAAIGGAWLVMVSHGLVSGMLFFLAGALYSRTHTRTIARFGGLQKVAPAWGTAFTFAALASLGLPGLSGFPGEFLTFIEAFGRYEWWLAVVAFGLVVSAGFHLWAVRRVNHGPVGDEFSQIDDLDVPEWTALVPLALSILALGVWPSVVLEVTDPIATAIGVITGGGT